MSLLDHVLEGSHRPAVTMTDGNLTYSELKRFALDLTVEVSGEHLVGLWATPETSTVVGLCASLICGTTVVPLNPKSSESELDHVLHDAKPSAIIASASAVLPASLSPDSFRRITPKSSSLAISTLPARPSHASSALIMYTSGTTGPPKGVILSADAVQANLEALAQIWSWTEQDHLVQALPLFHVHGLVLGVLGPLFVGASVHHVGTFSVESVCTALLNGGTMLFGVPTMYHRMCLTLDDDSRTVNALSRARLLVSGSGPLLFSDFERIERSTGHRVIERYGMTETLMISSADPRDVVRPGFVGHALPSMDVRVIDDDGNDVPNDEETIGSVIVRGASMFDGYLNQPGATKETFSGRWFSTGDLGVMAEDGNLRLVGRASTDLIKSGGYRIGTGEIEQVLLEHPEVAEVAVIGQPDPDLGERIVAWVVPEPGRKPAEDDLISFVAQKLSAHKRPREIVLVEEFPRNAMGKIQKKKLQQREP